MGHSQGTKGFTIILMHSVYDGRGHFNLEHGGLVKGMAQSGGSRAKPQQGMHTLGQPAVLGLCGCLAPGISTPFKHGGSFDLGQRASSSGLALIGWLVENSRLEVKVYGEKEKTNVENRLGGALPRILSILSAAVMNGFLPSLPTLSLSQ